MKTSATRAEIIRKCILRDPTQTLDQIRYKTGIPRDPIILERHRMIAEGLIPLPDGVKEQSCPSPELELLFKTNYMLGAFLAYATEMLEHTPAGHGVLVNPLNKQEEDMRWGFFNTLDGIQKVCKAIEGKYNKKETLRIVK